ncbi:hypothetical protein MKS88_003475 [Plasmodium brasilianum]|uniref:Uncharacterized protein n=1 Tax=Plasmodium brasilianum TaxID=5824 RepID=A0ACB9YAQ9_PLABR|nr:hypothetical protein MKS88_003475 [Plasmodium brasilianum]
MEQKSYSIVFIKFSAFIFLTWICYIICEVNKFTESFSVNSKIRRILDARIHRLLAKYKQNRDSYIVELKDVMPNRAEYEKKNISNNKEGTKRKNKEYYKSSLNKAQFYTEVMDYNNGMFDGKHFHFEKKFIRKKDYDDFLQKSRRLHDIDLKKIKFRSYSFGVIIFILFCLLGIGLPILRALDMGKKPIFESFSSLWNLIKGYLGQQIECLGVEYFYGILFSFCILVLAVIIIITIPKILRNNEKYKKIKLLSN